MGTTPPGDGSSLYYYWYNILISALTTLYENLWHQSMFYASHITLYDFLEFFLLNFFPISIGNQSYTVLVFETFCLILVLFLGYHIWSLYDCQESMQIIYDLVWLLRIIYDLVRNQKKLYDCWPGPVVPTTRDVPIWLHKFMLSLHEVILLFTLLNTELVSKVQKELRKCTSLSELSNF